MLQVASISRHQDQIDLGVASLVHQDLVIEKILAQGFKDSVYLKKPDFPRLLG